MKSFMFFVVGFMFMCNTAMADSSGYGISLGYGKSDKDIDIYRLGMKKDFSGKWFESDIGYVSGYFEFSYNEWRHHDKDIRGVALSPVFSYNFGDASSRITPYIEGGIGVTYIDGRRIADKDLSTDFQFEDRVGIGVKIGVIDINFRYMHYSNASIKGRNDGINILIYTTVIRF